MVVGCQPYEPAAFTPRKYSWYSFLLEAESTPEPLCDRKDFISMKNQLIPAWIEPATFRFVVQHFNHCSTTVPFLIKKFYKIQVGVHVKWWLFEIWSVILEIKLHILPVVCKAVLFLCMSQRHSQELLLQLPSFLAWALYRNATLPRRKHSCYPVVYPGILFGWWGFNKFSWGQKTERVGIRGR